MEKNSIFNYHTILLIVAFLFGGFIHVVLWDVFFSICIVQIYYAIVMGLWCVTIRIRIIDRRVCNIITGIGALGVLYFVLQMGKYALFQSLPFMCRFLWYAYYIPMIGTPLLLFFMAIYMNRADWEKPNTKIHILTVLGIFLIIGFLTNDLHGLALFTPGSVLDESNYIHGVLFYAYVVFVFTLTIAAYTIILKKCRLSAARKRSWIPVVVILIGVCGLISTIFDVQPKINGITIWRMAEIYVFMSAITLETCIQIGMIPSNIEYRRLFQKMKTAVEIHNQHGQCVVATDEPLTYSEKVWIQSIPIDGGFVSWALDMTKIYELNEELDEATEQIAMRNQYLMTENSVKEEQTVLDARNHLYNRISEIVRPQLEKIETLLQEDEGRFTDRLAKITVLNAYIKRRSNMELIKGEQEVFSINELRLAIAESAEYLRLCKVDVALTAFSNGIMPSAMITQTYEFFENVVEKCMDDATAMIVALEAHENVMTLRMLIHADTLSWEVNPFDDSDGYRKKLNLTKQGDDTSIAFTISNGGEAV